MVEEGASIIDLGAQSTRPGSTIMDIETEVKTLIPVIKTVRETLPTVPLSVDTYYADVAEAAIEAGASIINDISGGRFFSGDTSCCSTKKSTLYMYAQPRNEGNNA